MAAILLPPGAATPFGLVLHELAAIADKIRGAAPTTAAGVTADGRNNQQVLTFECREVDGPALQEPGAQEVRSTLIDTAIRGAQVKRKSRPAGLGRTIEVPLRRMLDEWPDRASPSGGPWRMPLYTFQLLDGERSFGDETGVWFADREHAFEHARDVARELMSGRETQTRTWRLDVYEDRVLVGQLPFASVDHPLDQVCGKRVRSIDNQDG